MEFFEEIDKSVYIIVINVAGLLKSLKKLEIENEKTKILAKFVQETYSKTNNIVDSRTMQGTEKLEKIKTIIVPLLIKLSNYMVDEFNGVSKEITIEKSDIYNKSLNLIEKINTKLLI